MRIGIFTDTYHPAVNGITRVVDEARNELTAMGHEVYVVAPSPIRWTKTAQDSHVIRIPAFKDLFFEDQFTSMFFPPLQVWRLRRLQLDVVLFLTPAQIGTLGAYTALKYDIPLAAMYCTDVYQYIRHYPSVIPGVLALMMSAVFMFRVQATQLREIFAKLPARDKSEHWSQKLVSEILTILHNRCGVVIAPSRKVRQQLESWGTHTPIHVIPTGVEPLPAPEAQVRAFREQWQLQEGDAVMLFVGRLEREKNLELPIRAFDRVKKAVPHAKLLFVGDSAAYKAELEALVAEQRHASDIIFAGRLPHDEVGVVYKTADLFLFPSLTDTQGLVVHEAAQAGLPIVMCDSDVTEVVKDGENGFIARNDSDDFAEQVIRILSDDELRAKMSRLSEQRVEDYDAHAQARKLLAALSSARAAKSSDQS